MMTLMAVGLSCSFSCCPVGRDQQSVVAIVCSRYLAAARALLESRPAVVGANSTLMAIITHEHFTVEPLELTAAEQKNSQLH